MDEKHRVEWCMGCDKMRECNQARRKRDGIGGGGPLIYKNQSYRV